MVSADENKPIAGSGKRNARQQRDKAAQPDKKSEKQSRKPRQKAQAKPDRAPAVEALEQAVVAPEQTPEVLEQAPLVEVVEQPETAAPEQVEASAALVVASPAEIAAADTSPAEEPAAAAALVPVSYQTITSAYGDYTRRSIEQTSSFFAELAGARSFSKALELQTEYAKQACETFVAESQRIRKLHREMTRQRLQRIEGLMTGTTRSR